MSRKPGGGARREWGSDDSGATILHVDMDSFFASVEILDDPSLAGRPVIVGGGERGVVTSATYEARARGIHAAMPLGQARRLYPDAIFLRGRQERYREISRQVMAVLGTITPVVEQVSVDEAFLDVSGSTRRLGPPVRIGTLIRSRIREEVGVPASVGVAGTKHVAKLASAAAKPDGLLLIPVASTLLFVQSLPVGALWGVGARSRESLERRGVRTVEQLAHIPERTLARWLGEALAARLLDLAWGRDDRRVETERVEKSIGTETTFSENVSDRGELGRVLLGQAHECGHRLREGGLEATRVAIKVRFADFTTISRSKTLAGPTQTGAEIAAAARSLFGTVEIPPGGVRLIGVRAEGLLDGKVSGFQATIDVPSGAKEAEEAMDRVRERFGLRTLAPASLLDPARRQPGQESEHSDGIGAGGPAPVS